MKTTNLFFIVKQNSSKHSMKSKSSIKNADDINQESQPQEEVEEYVEDDNKVEALEESQGQVDHSNLEKVTVKAK